MDIRVVSGSGSGMRAMVEDNGLYHSLQLSVRGGYRHHRWSRVRLDQVIHRGREVGGQDGLHRNLQ